MGLMRSWEWVEYDRIVVWFDSILHKIAVVYTILFSLLLGVGWQCLTTLLNMRSFKCDADTLLHRRHVLPAQW